jgi:ferritin-like metal-binding protein YciE
MIPQEKKEITMDSLEALLHDQLKDLYSAEQQLTKALPRMARAVATPQLRQAIENHLRETEGHVDRLDRIAEHLEVSLRGKKCKGMEGLIEEGKEVLEEEGDESVLDAGIIAAAQRVEHYEISAYGSARALAERLGLSEVVQLLQESLDEESAADEKLTQISEQIVLDASPVVEGENEEDEMATTPRPRASTVRRQRR